MPDDLYDRDAVAWSVQQAALLRRAAAGERVNGLDWDNLIEEIESVGKSEVRAVRSLLTQGLIHLLKLAGWPECGAADHWRAEVVGFLRDAGNDFTPSMRQLIDLERLYRGALVQVRTDRIDGTAARALADTCPLRLDDLVAETPDILALVARITAASS